MTPRWTRPFADGGVLELVADRDLVAEPQQPRDVGVALVPGIPHIGIGSGSCLLREVSVRPEQARAAHRVVEEHLVEVAEPEEQERVGVLDLDAGVLLHERRFRRRASRRSDGPERGLAHRALSISYATPSARAA